MYFSNLNIKDISHNQEKFVRLLADLLIHFKDLQIESSETLAKIIEDKASKFLELTIPHKIDKEIEITIAVYDEEIIVFYWTGHTHFDPSPFEEDEGDYWIEDAVGFISELLQGNFEIVTTFKGDIPTKVVVYYLTENGEKELVSSTRNLNIATFNPLLNKRKVVKRVSYRCENVT